MALQTIDKLKSWFVTLAKPTQQQFWDWLDSYRHINTKITSSDLDAQLLQLLNNIPNRDALDQLIREFQEYNASLKALAFKDVADWNTDLQNKPTRLSEFQDDLGWQDELQSHIDDTDNPHEVTAAQIGLENVDNTSDLDKPVSNATKDALNRQEQDRLSFDNFLLSRVDVNTANIEMLNNITTVRGSVNTYAELQFINIGQEKIRAGDSYIVLKDESWGGNASIYVYNATGWIWVGEWTTQIQPANGDTLGTVQDSNDIKWSGGKGSVATTLQSATDKNNSTSNALIIRGSAKRPEYYGQQLVLYQEYDRSTIEAQGYLYLSSNGIDVNAGFINLGNWGTYNFNLTANSVYLNSPNTFRVQTSDFAEFMSGWGPDGPIGVRVKGGDGIEDNDFVTKRQLTAITPQIYISGTEPAGIIANGSIWIKP